MSDRHGGDHHGARIVMPGVVFGVIGEAAALQSHQVRWDCLAKESGKVPRCRELAKLKPDDADYCEEAVSSCKAQGVYENLHEADERLSVWGELSHVLRLALLAATFGSLTWVGIVQPIRRMLRSA
jgi:hypothetical protein